MKRIGYIDQISGLLIVYMILFHIFQFCDMRYLAHSCLMQTLSFFHVEIFVYASEFSKVLCPAILYLISLNVL